MSSVLPCFATGDNEIFVRFLKDLQFFGGGFSEGLFFENNEDYKLPTIWGLQIAKLGHCWYMEEVK